MIRWDESSKSREFCLLFLHDTLRQPHTFLFEKVIWPAGASSPWLIDTSQVQTTDRQNLWLLHGFLTSVCVHVFFPQALHLASFCLADSLSSDTLSGRQAVSEYFFHLKKNAWFDCIRHVQNHSNGLQYKTMEVSFRPKQFLIFPSVHLWWSCPSKPHSANSFRSRFYWK